jgi:hypothetical protein
LGGQLAQVQLNAKALYGDGSVRHGVIAIELPELEPRARLNADLTLAASASAAPSAAKPLAFKVPPVDIVLTMHPAGAAAKKIAINLPTVTNKPESQIGRTWLEGPLAQERRFVATINDHLEIVFDVFVPSRGAARIDIAFHNDWAGIRKADTIAYDVEMSIDGHSVYHADNIKHYPYADWHRVLWTDGQPVPRIIANLDDLIAAAAVPRYASGLRVDADLLAEMAETLRAAGDAPLGPAMVTKFMPQTGGRWDIGPLPTWTVAHLLVANATTQKELLANGDAAGSIPWHIRDRTTRLPLTIDTYPNIWPDGRGSLIPGVFPEPFDNGVGDWNIDQAHEPSLVYVPYLLTGSQYYRDELAQQAAYELMDNDAEIRGRDHGYIIGEHGESYEQVRGLAWTLRTQANAAFILPTGDPMQVYLETKLKSNLQHMVQLFVRNRMLAAAGELEGWVPGDERPQWIVAPWQQAFLAMILDWINDMGYSDAGRTLAWMSNFLGGLFTSADKGFDPRSGAAYLLDIRDKDTMTPLHSWADVYKRAERSTKPVADIEEEWMSYGAPMRAGLGAALTVTLSPKVAQAYAYIISQTPTLRWDYAKDPTFAIVPRLGDGAALKLANILRGKAGGGPIKGGDGATIILGGPGDDQITGGASDDILFGGDGNDTIDGGPGNNLLFGDKSDDTLIAGPGNDVIMGGPGHDKFAFGIAGRSVTKITDFDPREDRLAFARGLVGDNEAAFRSAIAKAVAADGNLEITLPTGGKIVLMAIHNPAQVSAAVEFSK